MLTYLTLLVAFLLSGVAGYYSIVGLMAIFAGAQISIAIMGGVLEIAKLLVASWLYRNWKQAPVLIKTYLMFSLFVLMVITSTGIYGYLSKAHVESSANVQVVRTNISLIDVKIQTQKDKQERLNKQIQNLDKNLDALYNSKNAIRGTSELNKQKSQRELLNKEIDEITKNIQSLELEKSTINQQLKTEELKVGPIRYVAELFFNKADNDVLEKSIRYLIIIIVLVFDPLAILLIVAANLSLKQKDEVVFNVPQKRKYKKVKIASTKDGKEWQNNTAEITDFLK